MLSFSFEAMTTLGSTDLMPKADWLRILMTVEALIGFALVTASVSWIVLLYPALGRMRTLARRAWILARAERKTGVEFISAGVESLSEDLALQVIRSQGGFHSFPDSLLLPRGASAVFSCRGYSAPGAVCRSRVEPGMSRARSTGSLDVT